MNYILRNQQRIADKIGVDLLGRMVNSLDLHFDTSETILLEQNNKGDNYFQILVNDIGHTTNLISFYVVAIDHSTFTLAFNEFIG